MEDASIHDRASTLGSLSRAATFEVFTTIWERDYLSLSKPSTQSSMRSNLKRLKAVFGDRDLRSIGAGDIQHFVAASMKDGLSPKSIRNHWGTVNLIWMAAVAQKYVDTPLAKPKLPRRPKKKAKFFTLATGCEDHLGFSRRSPRLLLARGRNRVTWWRTRRAQTDRHRRRSAHREPVSLERKDSEPKD